MSTFGLTLSEVKDWYNSLSSAEQEDVRLNVAYNEGGFPDLEGVREVYCDEIHEWLNPTTKLNKGEMVYTPHHKEDAQGHIFINKSGASTINLIGAAAMKQEELDKYGKLFAKAEKMEIVLHKLIDSLPELDSEDEPLEGSEAVSILSQLWEEIKNSVE